MKHDLSSVARNSEGHPLVIGCNYHTTWQSHKAMRFVLTDVNNGKAALMSRKKGNRFVTNVDDLIFIRTNHNFNKAEKLIKNTKL